MSPLCEVCRRNQVDFDNPQEEGIICGICRAITCESCSVHSSSEESICFKCANSQSDDDQILRLNED